MFFEKQSKAHNPSIHEMRMEQMFPSSGQAKKGSKANYDPSSFRFIEEKARASSDTVAFLKQYVEHIRSIDFKHLDLFEMNPDTAHEYYLYKKRKEGKLKTKNINKFSFYEIDGSINYFKVFSGAMSENIYIRERAMSVLEETLHEFLHSQVFIDYVSMIFSCCVALFLFFNIFFNVSTFLKYYLNFLF